ncbi:MAG: HNH endonuclease [Deltaproteobacteria bacterium]|nr:HNH endonuclease [Deltaproteobacteria bacterium]
MQHLLATQVLVVNRSYQPVHITSARRAFVLLFMDVGRAVDEGWTTHTFASWRALAVGEGELTLGISGGEILIPRVLQLPGYDRLPRSVLRLTRRNVYLRDGYSCQYCGRKASAQELNLDHVMPRSRGGPTTWENLVCSCRVCNLAKGGRTPAESGMALLRRPVRPRWSPILTRAFSKNRPAQWDPYLAMLPGAKELESLFDDATLLHVDDATLR